MERKRRRYARVEDAEALIAKHDPEYIKAVLENGDVLGQAAVVVRAYLYDVEKSDRKSELETERKHARIALWIAALSAAASAVGAIATAVAAYLSVPK